MSDPFGQGRTVKELETYQSSCGECKAFLNDCRCAGPFRWFPELGYGTLFTKHPFDYPQSYFENFAKISEGRRGEALNEARLEFVAKWWEGLLLDVGIGSGAFLEMRTEETVGYDVADTPKKWLEEKRLWFNPFDETIGCATFWDSLEHMEDPASILARIERCVFISIPIFRSAEHARASHHFKPREHLWYFTEWGLLEWMAELGWGLLERTRMEERFGRIDVGTYAFARER